MPIDSYLLDWANLLVRWLHVTAGIAWIGASFYFNWLEGNLDRSHTDQEKAGELWAIHGGGFYHLNKYKIAPKNLPEKLHWFKWEAYITWLSGLFLLAIVYYAQSELYLIDPQIKNLTAKEAIMISLASLAATWLIYDFACKSILASSNFLFTALIFTYFCFLAWAYSELFSARASFIHIGAAIGTLMVANVFFVIIPNQKKVVASLLRHESADESLGKKALQRSLHNNYFTLPVLFTMTSNHFPFVYGSKNSLLFLAGLSLAALLIRHFFNLKNKGRWNKCLLPVSGMIFLGLYLVYAPKKEQSKKEVPFATVKSIIAKRCTHCHSAHPTDDIFKIAPNGVQFDSDEQILLYKQKIYERVVLNKNMPLANRTEMTEDERKLIKDWLEKQN